MIRGLRVTAATAARRSVADRGGLLFTLCFYLVVTSVITTLWRTGAEANGGDVAGYSAAALAWYLAASESTTVSLNPRLIEVIGDDIGSGAVAVELLRPAPLVWIRIAIEVGRALPRLVVTALAGTALAWTIAGAPPRGSAALLAVPALVLAIVANLLGQHAFAALAFWVRDARSTWFLYHKLVFVLGGMLLPLEVLPEGLAAVAKALPFMAMSYVPARLASGHVEPELLVLQAGWVVVLGVAAAAAFGAGERRLQVVGG